MNNCCGVWMVVVAGWLMGSSAAAQPITDQQVADAMQRMGDWLIAQQDPDGSWESGLPSTADSKFPEFGQTAVVAYGLLSSGRSFQEPAITKALEYMATGDPSGVYATSMCTHVYALLPDEFKPRLEKTGQWLMGAHWKGHYDYGAPPRPRNGAKNPEIKIDTSLSRTQYGVLGVWELVKRGGKIDQRFWEDQRRAMIATQEADGGWNYGPRTNRASTEADGGMTTAGIMIQLIAQQQLDRERQTPDPDSAASIQRGLDWLDQNYQGKAITGRDESFNIMYWYGLERIGLAAGISRINGRDWFEDGVREILSREKDGEVTPIGSARAYFSKKLETAYSLAFLSRGSIPLWASKLKIPGQAWNNRPNDLYYLTRFLSDQREAELNWQVVSLDGQPADWLLAPVLYVSADDAIDFTDDQRAKIKRYLDLGGLLLVNSEGRGTKFRRSFEDLAEQMYPDYKLDQPGDDHPFLSLITPVGGNPRLRTVSNGARDLIVIAYNDWGYDFQAEEPGRGKTWDLMTNLYASVTDRGELRSRFEPPLPIRSTTRKAAGNLSVVRATYDGNWNAEPLAMEIAGIDLFNRSGQTLDITEVPLAELAPEGGAIPKLVHLTGTAGTEQVPSPTLTEDDIAGVKRFVDAGGTVLIETVGGLGSFADDLAGQLAEPLGGERRWIEPTHPIVTGEGLEGATDAQRINYRSYTRLQGSPGDAPTLAAIFVGERPAVILSPRDLSLGILGNRTYRINGYAPDSARALMSNILLWAAAPPAP